MWKYSASKPHIVQRCPFTFSSSLIIDFLSIINIAKNVFYLCGGCGKRFMASMQRQSKMCSLPDSTVSVWVRQNSVWQKFMIPCESCVEWFSFHPKKCGEDVALYKSCKTFKSTTFYYDKLHFFCYFFHTLLLLSFIFFSVCFTIMATVFKCQVFIREILGIFWSTTFRFWSGLLYMALVSL